MPAACSMPLASCSLTWDSVLASVVSAACPTPASSSQYRVYAARSQVEIHEVREKESESNSTMVELTVCQMKHDADLSLAVSNLLDQAERNRLSHCDDTDLLQVIAQEGSRSTQKAIG